MSQYRDRLNQQRAARGAHIEAWRGGGLTQAQYCREHQLNATTFSGWLHEHRVQKNVPSADAAKLAVTAVTAVTSASAASAEMKPKATGKPEARAHSLIALRIDRPEPAKRTPPTQTSHEATFTIEGAGGWRIEVGAQTPLPRIGALLTLLALSSQVPAPPHA